MGGKYAVVTSSAGVDLDCEHNLSRASIEALAVARDLDREAAEIRALSAGGGWLVDEDGNSDWVTATDDQIRREVRP